MSISKAINPSTLTAGVASLIGVAFLLGASPAQAGIINGGFETGDFTGWNTIGNTSIETAAFGTDPTEGMFQSLMSTGGATVSDRVLESFLGLDNGSLDALAATIGGSNNATSGSAIKQTFTAKAGDILTFDWNFLTNEFTPTFFNDFSLVSLTGLDLLADTFSPFIASFSPFSEETGFETFEFTIPVTGIYTLGIGVVDAGDSIVDSGLLVDNIQLETVPEPASVLGLLAVGAMGVSSTLKRKKMAS